MDPNPDQTANEAPPSRKRVKKQEPNPQAEMKMHKTEDDVLDVIEGVESQLGALRQAHEDHRKAMKDLAKQRREVDGRSEELDARETELTTREVELAEMRQDFESREINLVQRASGLEQRESKIASQAELLEQHEADLEAKDKSLESKISELDAQLAGLSKSKAELAELEAQVKKKLAKESDTAEKLAQANAELDQAKAYIAQSDEQLGNTSEQLESLQSSLDKAVKELEASKQAHELACKELKSTESKLRGREIELSERSHTLEELAEKAGGLEHDLSESRSQYESQLEEAKEQLAIEQQTVQTLKAKVEELEQTNAQANAQSSGKAKALQDQLEIANAELETLRVQAREIADEGQSNEGKMAELASELEKSRAQVQSLQAQLNEVASSADEELTAERARIAEFESNIAGLTAELEEASAHRELLQSQLSAKPQVDPEELVRLREELEASRLAESQSQARLGEADAALAKLKADLDASQEQAAQQASEQLAQSEKLVADLTQETVELKERIAQLADELEEARSAPSIEVDEWNASRRDRLKKMRRILAGDAEKIRLATEALRSRYDQCEQVLSKRAELAQAYEVIESAQRKYQNREVRSGVFLGLIGMAAITLVLAATSWFVSDRVAPGMYAAKVTMAAAEGDTKLTEADMTAWEVYITELATDPRFLEVAADRMKRRGIAEFAVPGDLSKEMEQSLDVASAMPGTVVMEYRGVGAARTQRVLDTYAVALASAANNARARRTDSSMTIIEEEAVAGSEPLDTRRIEMAGMIFGGSMLLTLILGGVLWKRLSAAKAQFESDSQIDGLLDDSRWEMPS